MKDNIFKELIKLNMVTQNTDIDKNLYHYNHIILTNKYALLVNDKLGNKVDPSYLTTAALAHDLFKEHRLNINLDGKIKFNDMNIPQDLNKYIKENIDVLEKLNMKEYINDGVSDHSLAAAIFLNKNYNIDNPSILYPILFHSCMVRSVYESLSEETKYAVDIINLADKLSSSTIKIFLGKSTKIDLHKILFGLEDNEFNYTMAVYVARLFGNKGKKSSVYKESMEFYLEKLKEVNPLVDENTVKKLEKTQWQKRESKLLKEFMTYLLI